MKKIFSLIFIFLFAFFSLFSAELDPMLNMVKNKTDNFRASKQSIDNVASSFLQMETVNQQKVVNLIMMVDDMSVVNEIDFDYSIISEGIITARVPIDKLPFLANSEKIKYVKTSFKRKPVNDIAVPKMNSDDVHNLSGYQYYGNDVLVGVIDTGIDLDHPAFRIDGNAANNTRILYLWDQTVSGSGVSVGSFSAAYGREWTSSDINDGSCTQIDSHGHGTHVAGSFAGYDSNYTNRKGSATEADIIYVKTSGSNIIDGIEYMSERAAQIGKPIVINVSWGSQYGPHDGTDPDPQALNSIVSDSNGNTIIVYAAANEGNTGVHGYNDSVDTSGGEIDFNIGSYTPESGSSTDHLRFMFYYDSSVSTDIRITDSGGNTTSWFGPTSGYHSGTTGDGTGYYIESTTSALSFNSNIKRIFVYLGETDTSNESNYPRAGTNWKFEFRTSSNATRIDGWLYDDNLGGQNQNLAQFNVADIQTMTLGNDACAHNVITVAAYVSRSSWTAVSGTWSYGYTEDEIAPFSSRGPTRDERQKPDITAPGSIILSTKSSNDSVSDDFLPPDGSGYYRYMQGTSMAAPLASGAILLMKAMNPDWDYSDMLSYFQTHSQGTSQYSNQGSWTKEWGWGVIDVTDAISSGLSDFLLDEIADCAPGDSTRVSWSSAGDGVTYEVETSINGGTWSSQGTTTNLYMDLTCNAIGTWEIRVRANPSEEDKLSSNTEVFQCSNVEDFTSGPAVTRAENNTDTFILYNDNINISWSDTNDNSTYDYHYAVTATDNIPSSFTDTSSGSNDYFNLTNSDINYPAEGGNYWMYIKCVDSADPDDYRIFSTSFNLVEFMPLIMPNMINDNYISILIGAKGISNSDKTLNDLLYIIDENNVQYNNLKANTEGNFYSQSDFNTTAFTSTTEFNLYCSHSNLADDGLVNFTNGSLSYEIINVQKNPYAVDRRIKLVDSTDRKISIINVNYPHLAGLKETEGKIYYLGNLNKNPLSYEAAEGYKLKKWNGNKWIDISSINESGYYAVVTGTIIPRVSKTAIKQNYPNPFNPETNIPISIEKAGHVKLSVYDSKGKIIKVLLDEYISSPVENKIIHWDGKTASGKNVSSGIYYAVMKVNGKKYITKMVVIK